MALNKSATNLQSQGSTNEKSVFSAIDLREFPGHVFEGTSPKGTRINATVTIEDDKFVKLCLGELEPVQGFMSGKFKVKGDILMMQKLNTVMRGVRKSVL
ncbi:unnamed protein product [Caenorhabditis sp. 36 PRJEB53466]|nr:unnamed protein product [Caenorhabditis sp. 36 PRJEB53466]